MLRKNGRLAVALALAALLLSSAPAAATGGQERLGWLARAWQWAQALWYGNGGDIDPKGAPVTNSDDGLCIDPNGVPCAFTNTDHGAHIDPNGAPRFSTDNSAHIDPDG